MALLLLDHVLLPGYIYSWVYIVYLLRASEREWLSLVFVHCIVLVYMRYIWENFALLSALELYRVSRSITWYSISQGRKWWRDFSDEMNYFIAANSGTSSSLLLWTWLWLLAFWASELVAKLFVIRLKSVAVPALNLQLSRRMLSDDYSILWLKIMMISSWCNGARL